MKKIGYNLLIVTVVISIALVSCTKNEGIGGKASIIGKVNMIRYFQNYPNPIDTIDAANEEVYIIYGDNDFYNDNVETHFDGSFRFDFLREGNYTIYINLDNEIDYSIPFISVDAEITSSDQELNVGEIYIPGSIIGTASISGKISVLDKYDANFNPKTPVGIPYYSGEEDVYIVYEDNDIYFERFRTNYDGSYRFDELITGTYYVYAYTKDHTVLSTVASGLRPEIDTVVISEAGQQIVLSDILINR